MAQPTTSGQSFQFSIGHAYAKPISGLLATNPTPQEFGVIQSASVDFKQTIKTLMGNRKVAVDAAHAEMKITGKVEFANINTALFNNLLFAGTSTTGTKQFVNYEADTLVGTTYVATNASGFVSDYGVWYQTTAGLPGTPLVEVTTPSAAGQYSVNTGTGTYTFNAADTGNKLLISYSYTDASHGTTIAYSNQLMGPSPVIELVLVENYASSFALPSNALRLPACKFSDLSHPLKNEDYVKMSMSFEAFADPTGLVFEWYQIQS